MLLNILTYFGLNDDIDMLKCYFFLVVNCFKVYWTGGFFFRLVIIWLIIHFPS